MTRRTLGNRKPRPANTGDFVGRANEQQLFRATLRELERQRAVPDEELPEDLPYAQIFLVAAEGGMGKTRLMRRFKDIVDENAERADATAIYLDLETYHKRSPIGRDIERFLEVLHQELVSAGFADDLEPFRQERERRNAIHRRATDLAQEYNLQLSLGGRAAEPDGGLMGRDPAREGQHAAGKLSEATRAFIKRRLGDDEWRIFDDPYALTKKLMECVNTIATAERPLVLLLDTYEVADACDSWLREELLNETGLWLVWAIAGRATAEWFQAYETTFSAASNALRKIPLGTFVASDIEAYLGNHGIEPEAGLVAQLNGLSRGVPLALEAWVNLYQKGEPLPEPDRDSRTYRDVVRQVTERFLRYCSDDKLFEDGAREQRRSLRETILSFLLLRRTDHAALAAMWQCGRMDAERRLDDLRDQFSFVFADSVTRTPHALVKEFTCEDMRRNHLRESVAAGAERLRAFTAARMAECEREIHGQPAPVVLDTDERIRLTEERKTHLANLRIIETQISKYTELNAQVHLLTQRDSLKQQIADIDARLAAEQPAAPAGPRRPLWEDEEWGEWLLDHLNALAWCDRGGEKVLKTAVPLLVEAIAFNDSQAAAIIDVLEPPATVWRTKHRRTFEDLKQGRWNGGWATTDDELRGILSSLKQYTFTPLQQAILKLEEANMLRRNDQLAEATAIADTAAELLSNGGELSELFGTTYAQIGSRYLWREDSRDAIRSPEGLEVLHKAIDYHAGDAGSWYWLGAAEYKAGNPELAIAAYQQAIAIDPTYALPHNGLGNVHRNLKQYEAAISSYQQAITLDPTLAYPHNGLGNAYANLNQYEDAICAYQQAIALDPASAAPHNGLGNVYAELKQYDAAIAAYRQAITIAPNLAVPYNGLGVIYEEQQQYALAIEVYQRAAELNPIYAAPHRNLGDVYSAIKQYDDAITAYQQAITLDPTDAYAYNRLGVIYKEQQQYDLAIKVYQCAIELDPTYVYAHSNLGDVYRATRQHDLAIAAYHRAIELDPTYVYAHNGLGSVYRNCNQYEAAITAYQQASTLDPNNADFHLSLGNIFSVLDQLESAEQHYQKAIELDPTQYHSLGALARLAKQRGELQAIETWIDQARALLPEDDHYNGACLQSIAGDTEEAIRLLQLALEAGGSSKDWARSDPDFIFIRDDPRFQALVGEEG